MSALVRRVPRNTIGRDLIIGDVHGHFSKMWEALERRGFSPQRGDRLFSVGDLIDRGPESEQVLDLLGQPWFFPVMGNHEQMAIMSYLGSVPDNLYRVNGGDWFLRLTRARQFEIVAELFCLPVAIELETEGGLVGIVHAACDHDTWQGMVEKLGGMDGRRFEEPVLWGRDRASGVSLGPVGGVRAVVVGHTPMKAPTSLENVIYIDTGAWIDASRPFCLLNADTLQPEPGNKLPPLKVGLPAMS